MIQKVVAKGRLKDASLINADLAYWLKRSPQERVAAVDYLRRQYHGSSARLQRIVRIIQRAQS